MFLNGVPIMRIVPPSMAESDRILCDTLIRLVDDACNEFHTSTDWTANMRLVDEINNTRSKTVISETVRAIRKKLAHKSLTVVMLALTLTETLVKNCTYPLHREIAKEGFMQDMTVLAKKHCTRTRRESLQVANKTLDLIQSWGEAFLPQRKELPLFVETYHILRKEGLPFEAQYQVDRPPVLEPAGPGSLLDHQSESYKTQGEGLTSEESELLTSVETAAEMLSNIAKSKTSLNDTENDELMLDLVAQIEALQPSLVHLIAAKSEESPNLLGRLFAAKDSLESALDIHRKTLTGNFYTASKPEVNLLDDDFSTEDSDSGPKNYPMLPPPPGKVKNPEPTSHANTEINLLDDFFSVPINEPLNIESSSSTNNVNFFAAFQEPNKDAKWSQSAPDFGLVSSAMLKSNPGIQPPSQVDKRESLLANLGALYSSGSSMNTSNNMFQQQQQTGINNNPMVFGHMNKGYGQNDYNNNSTSGGVQTRFQPYTMGSNARSQSVGSFNHASTYTTAINAPPNPFASLAAPPKQSSASMQMNPSNFVQQRSESFQAFNQQDKNQQRMNQNPVSVLGNEQQQNGSNRKDRPLDKNGNSQESLWPHGLL